MIGRTLLKMSIPEQKHGLASKCKQELLQRFWISIRFKKKFNCEKSQSVGIIFKAKILY